MADYVYTLTHPRLVSDEFGGAVHTPPDGAVGVIDLRSNVQAGQSLAETLSMFCAMRPDVVLDSTHHVLGRGDLRDMPTDVTMRSKWMTVTGYAASGAKLIDLLRDHLTNGGDPDGTLRCKPLMPTVQGELEIRLGGHSVVWREPFQFGVHAHTAKVEAVLQRDFRAVFENVQAGRRSDPRLAEKVLDYWCDKYRLDKRDAAQWQRLIPPDLRRHVAGPIPHATTITDNFDRTDNADMSVGAPFSWTDVVGDQQIVSNTVQRTAGAQVCRARAESDLSGSDHYAQVVATAIAGGTRYAQVAARYASAADTAYWNRFVAGTTTLRVFKVVEGVETALGTGTTQTFSNPDSIQMRCNGSTLDSYLNGSSVESFTDTAITTGTRCGIGMNSNANVTIDDFEAADLAVAVARVGIIGGGVGRLIGA